MSSFDNITLVWISYSTTHANLKHTYQMFYAAQLRLFQNTNLSKR